MADKHAPLIVIGKGTGGYACAFRAADLGLDATLVDPRASLGGICLTEGCILSNALLHVAELIREAAHLDDRGIGFSKPDINLDALRTKKDGIVTQLTSGLGGLAKRRKATVVQGTAQLTGPKSLEIDGVSWSLDKVDTAVGSRPVQLPGWPEDDRIWESTAALELREIPERLVIIGGIIGLEMATAYSALGSQVIVIEFLDQIASDADGEAVTILHGALVEQRVSETAALTAGRALGSLTDL